MVAEARGGYDSVAVRLAATTVQRDAARALVDADAALAERTRSRDAARADLQALLAASPFTSADDAVAALLEESALATLDATIAEHRAALTAAKQRLLDLELDTAGDDVDEAQLAASATALADADAARSAAIAAHRDAVGTAARLRGLLAQTDAAYADVAEAAEAAAIVTRLADTVAGRAPNTMKMDLETFVLAAELEEIVAAANIRLAEMSLGRYTLHHSDARAARGRASGLGIDVLDAHTGRLRPPQSLSGGETFLASLALALGLGEVVTARAGGIRLDTLFVDEGFGSLDPETLELAMRTLDELRAGGRTVGVISHVEAMKEQVPAQVLVEATPEGPSVIRQDPAVRR
ncbi:SbcC/MukB-like Walker B domain-containing protein [Microbacterium aurum]